MTAQIPEQLRYNGENHLMFTNPLDELFAVEGNSPRFKVKSSALRRGYIGQWEIIDDRLYLTGLHGTLESGDEASVTTIFPGFPGSVFAHWYSGTIIIPQGELLEYVHIGYASTFEKELLLEIERGVVKSENVFHNSISAPEENCEF